MGNLFRKNFVVRVIGGNVARSEEKDLGDGSKLGRSGTGFWFNRSYYGYPVNNMTLSNFVVRGYPENLRNIYFSVTGMTF